MPRLPVRLGITPLIEAVWEVRFQSDMQAVSEVLTGRLFERVAGNAGAVDRLPAANMPPEFRDQQPMFRYVPTIRIKNDPFLINVGEHVVMVGSTRPYVGWQRFSEKIRQVIEVVRDSGVVTRPERYSLKYVDLLAQEQPATLRSLSLNLQLGNIQLTTEPTQIRFEVMRGEYINVVQARLPVTLTPEVGEQEIGLLIDIDTIRNWENPEDAAGFWAKMERNLEVTHQVNKELFFREILTPETTERYQPIYE